MSEPSETPDSPIDNDEVADLAASLGLLGPGAHVLAAHTDVRAWLISAISPVIDRWLRSDRARLGQALYRLDVDERLVEDVVRASPIDEVATRVAALVVDRVICRITNRRRLEQMLRDG